MNLRNLLLAMVPLCSGTVYLPEYNSSFASMPALFGNKLPVDDPVQARLFTLEDWPQLCPDDGPDPNTIEIPVPSDGLPVALLVKRGECTFWQKGEVALSWDHVQYVIVYDNKERPDLVPMYSEDNLNMTLLFVSFGSGTEMRDMLLGNEDISAAEDGIFIEMDAIAPLLPPMLPEMDLTAYMIAALSGFLAFLVFFGLVLLCAHAGLISASRDERGRIIVFAGGNGASHRSPARKLLTEEQVRSFEEQEIKLDEEVGEDEEGECSCAICLEEFSDGEKVRVLPCNHKFHDDCLVPWLTERHASCPLCKFDVLEHLEGEEEENTESTGTEQTCSVWGRLGLGGRWAAVNRTGSSDSEEQSMESAEESEPVAEIELEATNFGQQQSSSATEP